MTIHFPDLAERVRSQAELQPDLYGDVDFTVMPYRWTVDPDDRSALSSWLAERGPLLADESLIELIRTATLLGDVVADPYAALVETYGMKGLIGMLSTACRDGIDAVPDAPDELRTFLASMEATPAWLDMELVEEGARHSRVPAAFLSPFIMRGAFLGTFTNTYAALPMALTGALSGKRAARRVIETSSFFLLTTLPGALERHGIGFETAAHVRLMHSVVRYNALKRSAKWDREVYGIPVPQVDQMPAGMINILVLARAALAAGRTEWTPRERAIHEFVRYRCFLLGMPEELLSSDPAGIMRAFATRQATLRHSFDDEICGELVRSTMAAYLLPDHSLGNRVGDRIERAWSKVFVSQTIARGPGVAASMGIDVTAADKLVVALTAPFVLGRLRLVMAAGQRPRLAGWSDRYAQRVLNRRLTTYGIDAMMTENHGAMSS
ncbi:hypothetical protein ACLM5J_03595 [Nocardioides sp. Bht2]|uniref:hypothetical protein n=1 Tax=Nocardioides sp. Bht2 TaxID=3392297 RepID=UPI0039B5A518